MSIETNRRDALAGAAVSGLVASVWTTPVAAQSTGVMATATEADYKRDPTRWGSADMAAHFPGFKHLDMRTSGAVIRLRHGGSGPPLLLVHGNPENHTCWYKVAARLAQQYHVVLPDLRGYGDSSLPEPGPNNINFSFPRYGTRSHRGHGTTRIPALYDRWSRPRWAHHAPTVPRSAKPHHQSLHHGRCAKLSRLDEHHEKLGDPNVALGLHGAAGTVSRAADQRRAG